MAKHTYSGNNMTMACPLLSFEVLSELLLHLQSQRLVDLLHQPSERPTIHSLGQGITRRHCLLKIERADHLWWTQNTELKKNPQYTAGSRKHVEQGQKDCHLLPFGSEFLVSECLPQGRVINTQQLENKNTSVMSNAFLRLFVLIWTAESFWPSQDLLSWSQWWYKFLLPPLPQAVCFQDGEHRRWCSAISEVRHKQFTSISPMNLFSDQMNFWGAITRVTENMIINTPSEGKSIILQNNSYLNGQHKKKKTELEMLSPEDACIFFYEILIQNTDFLLQLKLHKIT